MTNYEFLSIVIAAFALLISLSSIYFGNRNASASIELVINERITSTKEKVSDISILMTPLFADKDNLTSKESKMLESYVKHFDAAIENNLNAYEEACAKFIDKKVDKNRFKKIYISEIRQLVEKPELKKYFDGVSSKYKAILKVYNQWNNFER